MELLYWTVTKVFKSATSWAQLVNVKANTSDREYQNCEIITPKGMAYLPKIKDLVLFSEIHNSEIIILGVLEPYDLRLNSGETLLYQGNIIKNWKNELLRFTTKIRLTNWNIELSVWTDNGTTFTPTSSIVISPTSGISVNSNSPINITAPSVNIN